LARGLRAPHAVRTANEMRLNGETVSGPQRNALWGPIYFSQLFNADDDTRFLAILPGKEHLATFEWLYPKPRNEGERWCGARVRSCAHAGSAMPRAPSSLRCAMSCRPKNRASA
jgi:hypothetical protein